jgi:hypothetical protein
MAAPKTAQPGHQDVFPATVPRAYLKPEEFRKSMWHTAYVADPLDKTKLHKLEVVAGCIRGLPLDVYQRFADAGILTTERPRRRGEDDD